MYAAATSFFLCSTDNGQGILLTCEFDSGGETDAGISTGNQCITVCHFVSLKVPWRRRVVQSITGFAKPEMCSTLPILEAQISFGVQFKQRGKQLTFKFRIGVWTDHQRIMRCAQRYLAFEVPRHRPPPPLQIGTLQYKWPQHHRHSPKYRERPANGFHSCAFISLSGSTPFFRRWARGKT